MKKTGLAILFIFPLIAFAQNTVVLEFIAKVGDVIFQPLIILLLAFAAVVFLWGMIEFISKLDNEEERKVGIKHMIWGLIGIAVMVSFNGVINIIQNTINQF